jgi:hypothetical protein
VKTTVEGVAAQSELFSKMLLPLALKSVLKTAPHVGLGLRGVKQLLLLPLRPLGRLLRRGRVAV